MSDLTPLQKAKVLSSKQIIKAIEDDRKSQIDVRLLAKSIIREMGGEDMMGIEYVKLFRAMPQNSPLRIRLLEQMTKILSVEAEKPRPRLALDELDQDQLLQAIKSVVGEDAKEEEAST